MKKITFLWRYLALFVMFFSMLSASYADNREISGSVTSTSDYISCGTSDVGFNLTFESPDAEWGWEITMTFPEGFTINSASTINGASAVITGQEIYWPMNYFSSSESVDFTINLSADETVLGEQEFDYLVNGDGWGDPPHSFSGTSTISEDPNTHPELVVNPTSVDLGMWPIGGWQENAYFELSNAGSGVAVVTASELDDTDRAFALEEVSLPASLTNCGDPLMVGIAMDPDAENVDGQTYTGVYVASWDGPVRSVVTADVQVTAYTPLTGDIFEDPYLWTFTVSEPVLFSGNSNRELAGMYKNYKLPNDVAYNYDEVWKIVADQDYFFSMNLTSTNTNMALYSENFSGEGGPMASNALIQDATTITDFPLFTGTYYLVVGGDDEVTGTASMVPMTEPAGVTYTVPPTPADGAVDVINGDDLEWTYNDVDAIEYRVVLGTTYPPTDVVMPWTAINAAGDTYELTGLENNLQYFWRVDVQNNVGVTEGDVWGFTTTITPALNVAADNEELFVGDDVVLTWDSPVGGVRALLGYNVYRDGVMINTSLVTDLTFTDDAALAYNMTGYTYNVTSVFDEGESGYSNDVVVTFSGEGTVAGNVSDAVTTLDIEGAVVEFAGVDEYGNDVSYTTTTDANGDYTQDVLVGTYDLTASADGYIDGEEMDVDVTYDATTTQDFVLGEIPYAVEFVTATELNDDEVHLEWGFEVASFVPTHFPFDTEGLSDKQIEKRMIDYLASNGVANAEDFSMDAVAAGTRELVSFDIYRGLWDDDFADMTFVGNTTQSQFIDYDWGVQTSGVYKWAVVAVYSASESDPTMSNFLDKDMETVANVEVTLNSAESPAGTQVTLTNTSEPYLDLEYTTILGEDGMYTFDPIRKGTYDVEVYFWGYGTITETGVVIETETDLTYLLEELLVSPSDFYVNPNGFATWTGEITPYVEFMDEAFGTGIPEDWSQTQYSGTGSWVWCDGDDYQPDPPGDGKYAIASSDEFNSDVFDVGLFTAPFNFAGQSNVILELDRNFQDYAGDGEMAIRVYSGGMDASNLEETLDWSTTDDPGGQHYTYNFDPSAYSDPTDVYIEFWYSTEGGTYAWGFGVDNVVVHNGGVRGTRELQQYRVWLDDVISGEPTDEFWDYEVEESLVEGQTYEAALASIYTTGLSPEVYYTFTYHACDYYNAATDLTATRVEGTMDIALAWTNDDSDVDADVFLGTNIYRDGEMYAFVEAGTEMYTDEDVASGTYEYCITQLYESDAESCEVCDTETMTPGGYVNGVVTDFPDLDPIEGATVSIVGATDSYIFTTDATGYYEGEVVEGTYTYNVSAPEYESQTLEDVLIDFGATVTNDFALLEYPYAVGEVIATELSDDAVLVNWSGQGGPTIGEWLTYDDGVNWNALGNSVSVTMSWAIRFEPAQLVDFEGSAVTQVAGYIGPDDNPTTIYVRIWSGADAANLLYEEDVTSQVTFEDWNEFTLSSAVPFDNTEELWIGFYGESAGESYPAGLSNTAPANPKGDLYNSGSGWLHASDLGAGDLIFNLSGYVTNEYGTRLALNSRKAPSDYKVLSSIPQPSLTVSKGISNNPKTLNSNNRALTGYNVYRGACGAADEDMTFMGYTLDQQFTDNTWGAAEAGVYSWAVEAVYDYNESEFVYSNCLDKDMLTTVSVEVSTNSGDSPIDTDVTFTNMSEPDLELMYETTLDDSGMFTWDEFRKGTYDILVHKNGFADIMVTGVEIWEPTEFIWVLEELLAPPSDLYVTPMGYATWGTGGAVPFEPYFENFDAGMPDTWTIVDGGETSDTWFWTESDAGSTLDGTPFMFVDSDAAGFVDMDELLVSPIFENTENADALFIEFDHYLNNFLDDDLGEVQVFDGNEWVNVITFTTDYGSWSTPDHVSIDVTDYANADFQVRFHYVANFGWYWAVDNFAVTDGSNRYADRELQYYKVWHDYNFITDTDTTFYQYGDNGEVLVSGETYMAEVAAVYSTGMSAKMQYEWTYYPCDSFPGASQFTAENIPDTKDVLLTWSTEAVPPPPVEDIIVETFEDYNAGDHLAAQAQGLGNDYWTTWSGTVGADEDPMVTDAQAFEGSNSIVVEGTNDAVLLLDTYTEGVFNVEFEIFIPTGKVGYFNLLQLFDGASSSWGTQTYFDPGGVGRTDAGGADAGTFSFTYDTWHNVYTVIDLDNDWAEMYFDGNLIVNWVWSSGAFGTNTLNQFNAMNLYAYSDTGPAGAYFDDIHITRETPVRSTRDMIAGANIYRDNVLIAEMVSDTFYVDQELVPEYYDYCIKFIYESGATSCGDCILDVYVPEDCTAPKNLTATLDEETWDAIYLEWNAQEEVFITQNPGAPANGYFQSYDYGYGVVYDLSAYPDAVASSIEFHHASWGTYGPFDYNIHIIDWDTEEELAVLGPFTTTGDDTWEMDVPLGEVDLMGATNVAFLMEPLSNSATDAYPDLSSDNAADPQGSVYGPLSDIGSIGSSTIGNFLMNIYIMTGYGQVVMAPRVIDIPEAVEASPRMGTNNVVTDPVINQTATIVNNDREFTGYTIYRDGSIIASFYPETTFTDTQNLVPGNVYCYQVSAVYSLCGESDMSNEACAGYVGLPEFSDGTVAIYPNPAKSLVNVSSTVEMNRITVTNYVGQVVYEAELNDVTSVKLNTGSYENGVYIIRLYSENGVVTKRVIIAQ